MTEGEGRRERRQFEPPPWEQEAFEALKRQRAETERAGATPAGAAASPAVAGDLVVRDELAPANLVRRELEPEAPEGEAAAATPAVSDAAMDTMLIGLSAEEPRPLRQAWSVAALVGIVCAVLGLALTGWAVVVLARTLGPSPKPQVVIAAWLGSASAAFMGLVFVGGGAYLTVRSLRQQGVL